MQWAQNSRPAAACRPLFLREALRLMETTLTTPALAAVAPVALQKPPPILATARWSSKRIAETVNAIAFYGLVGFGLAFPVVATIYALIVY